MHYNYVILITNYSFRWENQDKHIILIDPGHGGIDGGAKSKSGTIEKDINLDISLKLRDYLLEKGMKFIWLEKKIKNLILKK